MMGSHAFRTMAAARTLQEVEGRARRQTPFVPARGMFIQTQNTPNPASLMFLPGVSVMEEEPRTSADFPNARAALVARSPLARRLFTIDGVTRVFFGSDFVTVTKDDNTDWGVLKPEVFAAIMDHYSAGDPLFEPATGDEDADDADSDTAILDTDSEVVAMIKELLDTRIRPAVQEDGGDIKYRGFDEDSGIVYLQMQGACDGCPSSSVTLKSGIENMLMHYIDEVKSVEPWVDPDEPLVFGRTNEE